MLRFLIFGALLSWGFAFTQSTNIRIFSYNLLNFPNGRNDCGGSNVNLLNRWDTLRKITDYVQPDIFVACEVQEKRGADSVLSRALNYSSNDYAMVPWIANTSSGNELQNCMFYNQTKLGFISQFPINTGLRDINHYRLFVLDSDLSIHQDTTYIEVFMCHLKAGSGSAEQQQRADQALTLKNYISQLPPDRHYFVCGDLNIYTGSETAYQILLSNGAIDLFDPINSIGNWSNNSSFASIHTQSPRTSSNTDCGVAGGLDDRFDHIMVSGNLLQPTNRLHYVPNSYQAIGNSGNQFNGSVLTGVSSYPLDVRRALFYMSDHLPVVADFEIDLTTYNGLGLNPAVQNPTCAGFTDGSVEVTPTFGQAPYTYLWDQNSGGQTTALATGLGQGTHCVTVTDALGQTDTYCAYLTVPPPISYSVFVSPESDSCNGSAAIIASGGQGALTYLWDDPMSQSSNVATDLCAGAYSCVISDDSGCATVVNVTIVDQTLDIVKLDKFNGLSVFPNPGINEIYLHSDEPVDRVIILNALGQRFACQQSIIDDFSRTIYVDHLDPGTYIALVNERSIKFVIVH